MYSTTENTLRIYFTGVSSDNPIFQPNGKIRLSGDFDATEATQASFLNGREFTISSVQYANAASNSTDAYVQINTTGLGFPDADFNIKNTAGNKLNVMYNPSTTVEAFFEGAQNVYEEAPVNFASKKIVIREIGTAKQTDPGNDATAGAFSSFNATYQTNATTGSKAMLGLQTYSKGASETVQWVDELNPPVKVTYD